jgi:hypothetical protein
MERLILRLFPLRETKIEIIDDQIETINLPTINIKLLEKQSNENIGVQNDY